MSSARRLVREKLFAELAVLRKNGVQIPLPGLDSSLLAHDNLPEDPNCKDGKRSTDDGPIRPRKVCIVGAGIAGLYIAMILDSLKVPGLTYDILEANSRVGGRLYTHHFSENSNDYFDIGAMRFPDIPVMARTFDLFKRTQITPIPYYLEGQNTLDFFNDHFFDGSTSDPYHVSTENGGRVPDDVVDNFSQILEEAFGPYKENLAENPDTGFKELMKADDYSTREFLKRGGPDGTQRQYDFFSVQWMETMNTSSNLFDQAFSEIHEKLERKAETNKRVESISINWKLGRDKGNMSVKCADEPVRSGYCTVFATPTLGCLARMDLQSLELHPSQKDAIRSLHYDDSVKVALQFTYPWWIVDCGITQGGVASTDLPLRTCVYPSYNLEDIDKPAVLLASYTWAQDANRMSSLVDDDNKGELEELILRDLARLHAGRITYDQIKSAYTGECKAYSWSQDPTTAGAFALFGPGQFSNLYPYIVRPAAQSQFHIVGEAASTHHAWVAGALDSAYCAVYKFLYTFELYEAIDTLKREWGVVEELDGEEDGTAHLQVALGMLRKEDQVRV
ncbi:FAD/NAD(P)-binding domain-containing protein [Nemania sp. FL0916]|nr:FAD/NAD(P)-binding domain-containing protein [Nemania sp. FL0916]